MSSMYSSSGQRSRSNKPSFQLTETIKTHYYIKLHQNMTSSFQVKGHFLVKKTKIVLKVKIKFTEI